MSGSHHPGVTFKAKVVSTLNDQITFEAEPEDIAYFIVGTEYVLHVRVSENGTEDKA